MFSSSLTLAERRGKWQRDKGGENFGGKKSNDTKGNPRKSVPLFRAENARREAECTGYRAVDMGHRLEELSGHMNRWQSPSQVY